MTQGSAEPYLEEFGIATECGFGRRPVEQDVKALLQIHADVIKNCNEFPLFAAKYHSLVQTDFQV